MSETEHHLYGPPGTGKTTWIAEKAAECAERFGGDQVSLCSLTNTAIKEVISRRIEIPAENISTLHKRCKISLAAGKPAERYVREFIKDNPGWASTDGCTPCLPVRMVENGTIPDENNPSETLVSGGSLSLYEQSQILRQRLIPRDRWPNMVRQFSDAWEGWCRSTGKMDFTGWLEISIQAKSLPPQQVIFVDEAQDHTPLQLAAIRAWDARTVVLVGDDDQCLYEWSGSIPSEFFGKNLTGREVVLEQSYRVPRAVHRWASRFAKRINHRKDKVYMPRDFEGSVQLLDYSISDSRYDGILPSSLLQNPDETYMIIAACGYMLDPIMECLKARGIPFYNPYRKTQYKWNPLTIPGERLEIFLRKDRLWTGAEAFRWGELLRSHDVYKPGKKQEFLSLCAKRGSQLLLAEDLSNHFLDESLEMIMKRDMKIIKNHRQATGFPGAWDYAIDVFSKSAEERKPRLTIGTIHSVKGGEADNVYLIPDLSPSGTDEYMGSESDRIHRLFYVGITRAKKNLFLCSQSRAYYAINWE